MQQKRKTPIPNKLKQDKLITKLITMFKQDLEGLEMLLDVVVAVVAADVVDGLLASLRVAVVFVSGAEVDG